VDVVTGVFLQTRGGAVADQWQEWLAARGPRSKKSSPFQIIKEMMCRCVDAHNLAANINAPFTSCKTAALDDFPGDNALVVKPFFPSFLLSFLPSPQTDSLKCVAQASKNRSLADFEEVRGSLMSTQKSRGQRNFCLGRPDLLLPGPSGVDQEPPLCLARPVDEIIIIIIIIIMHRHGSLCTLVLYNDLLMISHWLYFNFFNLMVDRMLLWFGCLKVWGSNPNGPQSHL